MKKPAAAPTPEVSADEEEQEEDEEADQDQADDEHVVMKKPAAAPTPEASADADEQEEEEEAAQEQADDEHVQCISDGEAADEAPVEAAPGALGEADDEQLLSFSGFVHPLLGALSGGCYAKQSYFTAKAPGDLKKRLVVAVSEVQTGQHSIVCNKLFRWALANQQRVHHFEKG
jgi:hypothetical protein